MNKEKPILFSTPMVRAILESKKDMTRRVVKGPHCTDINGSVNIYGFWFIPEQDKDHAFDGIAPYCVGDVLWVRETFTKSECGEYIYRADKIFDGMGKGDFAWNWTPSIFMPREAIRIKLKVKHIRLERIQGISERDAVREGITTISFVLPDEKTKLKPKGGTFRTEFKHFWDDLNAKRGYGWDKNPWVWVIQFDRIKP
ncbi:MAG: hypothetical protein LBQ73_05010 [Tannerellaceae bacterium]|jgi:hypothetical protein|nr:hypothetical protein [Tannerellaceae bacterium]